MADVRIECDARCAKGSSAKSRSKIAEGANRVLSSSPGATRREEAIGFPIGNQSRTFRPYLGHILFFSLTRQDNGAQRSRRPTLLPEGCGRMIHPKERLRLAFSSFCFLRTVLTVQRSRTMRVVRAERIEERLFPMKDLKKCELKNVKRLEIEGNWRKMR